MTTRSDCVGPRPPCWPTAPGLVPLYLGFSIFFGRSLSRRRAGAETTYDDVVNALAGNNNASILLDSGGRAMLADLVLNLPQQLVNQALAAVAAQLDGPSTFPAFFLSAITVAALTVTPAHLVLRWRWALAFGSAALLHAKPTFVAGRVLVDGLVRRRQPSVLGPAPATHGRLRDRERHRRRRIGVGGSRPVVRDADLDDADERQRQVAGAYHDPARSPRRGHGHSLPPAALAAADNGVPAPRARRAGARRSRGGPSQPPPPCPSPTARDRP